MQTRFFLPWRHGQMVSAGYRDCVTLQSSRESAALALGDLLELDDMGEVRKAKDGKPFGIAAAGEARDENSIQNLALGTAISVLREGRLAVRLPFDVRLGSAVYAKEGSLSHEGLLIGHVEDHNGSGVYDVYFDFRCSEEQASARKTPSPKGGTL